MNNTDRQYQEIADHIIHNGSAKTDRTGTGTASIFGHQLRFNLQEGFPILTSKRVHFKSVIGELLWFLSGSTSATELQEKFGVTIWNEWKDEFGGLGPVYGKQWVDWGGYAICSGKVIKGHNDGINQIQGVIDTLKSDPDSRRMVVSAWNVSDLKDMALQPCHMMFQFYSRELTLSDRTKLVGASINKNPLYFEDFDHGDFDMYGYPSRTLSCHMYQRSCDVALGLPFNIASYAALTHMVAQQVNMIPDELIMSFGDIHVYNNHIHGLRNQLLQPVYTLPKLEIQKANDIFSYNMEDFKLINYKHSPKVKYEVAV